jgi:hypothetical protein
MVGVLVRVRGVGWGRFGQPATGDAPEVAAHAPAVTRRTTIVCCVVIIAVCCLAVGAHVHQFRHLGPLDEQAHLDYVNRLLDGELPALGEKVLPETRRQLACRGLETPAGSMTIPDCDRPLPVFPEEGNAYEATQPPLYYSVASVVSLVVPGDDIDSVRLVGGVWLGAGAIGVFMALRRLKVAAALATAAALVMALMPPLLFAASVVSNDIAVWTFGGLALWATVWLLQSPNLRWPQIVTAAGVGVGGALVKPTTLLVVAALAAAMLIVTGRNREWRRGLIFGGAMIGSAVVATETWALVVTSMQQLPLSKVQPWAQYRVDSLDFTEPFRRPLFNLVSPYKAFIPAEWRQDWVMSALTDGAIYLHVGLLFLPLIAVWPKNESAGLGVSYSAAIAISGPYYVIFYFVSTRMLYSSEPRFAFGLAPLLAVLVACWIPRPWQRWTVTGLLALPVVWYLLLMGDVIQPGRL